MLSLTSSNSVIYRTTKEVFISNPTEFPEVADTASRVREIQEPIVKASIIVPEGSPIRFTCLLADL